MATTETNTIDRITAALATCVDIYGNIDREYREIRNVTVEGNADDGLTLQYDTALGSRVTHYDACETAEEIADFLEAQITLDHYSRR